jgi:hypothetical protein
MPEKQYCIYCGSRLFDDDRTCPQCGAPTIFCLNNNGQPYNGKVVQTDCERVSPDGFIYLSSKPTGKISVITEDHRVFSLDVEQEDNTLVIRVCVKELAGEIVNVIYEVNK